ncbi:hypothetical protein [Rosistilla oblonga]|uniref:hypothetical protein n=1 Tax=Rosistilla oblonga TaxID=2527990 RepID=UPI003A9797A3
MSIAMNLRHSAWIVVLLLVGSETPLLAIKPCRIEIVEKSNGWPVPLVELTTTHGVRFVSDNAGVIAFDLPELLATETWFHVRGHGYSVPPDVFGYRGVRLRPQPGATLTVEVQRQLPAKRLGRITGGGLFSECQKLGTELDWRDQGILGCDSVQTALHDGRLHWGWGDTTLPQHPLGRFHTIGATTQPQPMQTFEPPIRLRYDYVVDETQTPRNIAVMPGDGPTWLGGYVSLPNREGQPQLVATYSKIVPPLAVYEIGFCTWDETSANFEPTKVLWRRSDATPDPPMVPHGHSTRWTDPAGGDWVLFGDPFPTLKIPATYEALLDRSQWQSITPQTTVATRAGESEKQVRPHRGSIAWNEYRKKWVAIFTQHGGQTSLLGEIWYAEADAPTGPWTDAVHVVTHDDYTFYNPKLHPEFTAPGSAMLLFEATYTKTFSGTKQGTPRHNYNQILYRLDLQDIATTE